MLTTGIPFPLYGTPGSATLPTYAFSGGPTDGFYQRAATVVDIACNGLFHVEIGNNFIGMGASRGLRWISTDDPSTGSQECTVVRDAANVLAIKNSTTAQTLRIYGTTTGPKYLLVGHDGTQGNIDLSGGGVLVLGASLGGIGLGASTVVANAVAANGGSQCSLTLSSTLASSPADWSCLRIAPTLTGQTVTRLNYLSLLQQVGTTTITDASALHFDAATGTHKALASNGAVASVFTANAGPTGASTAIQGWIKINVNGTLRYVPFW